MQNTRRLLLAGCAVAAVIYFVAARNASAADYQTDSIPTLSGELRITPINHATFMMQFGGKIIMVDPTSQGDYAGLPKADLVLITDVHSDHMDRAALDQVKKSSTVVVAPPSVQKTITEAQVISNGEKKAFAGFGIEAIPMYNITRGPAAGQLYHDKGRGNGYILTLGSKRIYISGDTECTPEMKKLKNIDVAFLCMNLPYTMTPQEAAECVKAFRPKIVYPYHYKGQNTEEFAAALKGTPQVEVRLRNWY